MTVEKFIGQVQEKTMKDYLKKVKELKKLGEAILDGGLDNEDFMSEVDCMDTHLECCIYELEASL